MAPKIRLATARDAERVAEIYSPYCAETAVSFETEAPSAEEMGRRIEKTIQVLPWLVLEFSGEILGYAYSSPHRERSAYRWAVDASAYVDKPYQRMGIGRALYTSLFELLRLQRFYRVHAGITLPNVGSVGLHEAMGFESVGVYRSVGYKLGKWHDVAWYQLPLLNPTGSPEEPKKPGELSETPEWSSAITKGLDYFRPSLLPQCAT